MGRDKNRTVHSAVRHHGGGGVIIGGIGAMVLFGLFAVMMATQSQTQDWVPLLIGVSMGFSAMLFGIVYHFTH